MKKEKKYFVTVFSRSYSLYAVRSAIGIIVLLLSVRPSVRAL